MDKERELNKTTKRKTQRNRAIPHSRGSLQSHCGLAPKDADHRRQAKQKPQSKLHRSLFVEFFISLTRFHSFAFVPSFAVAIVECCMLPTIDTRRICGRSVSPSSSQIAHDINKTRWLCMNCICYCVALMLFGAHRRRCCCWRSVTIF